MKSRAKEEPQPGPAPDPSAVGASSVDRARGFAVPLLAGQVLDTGEPALEHAHGVAAILTALGAGPTLRAAAYLVYAADHLQRPEDTLRKSFGDDLAQVVVLTRQLVQIQRTTRSAAAAPGQRERQTEQVRKMLLAFSRDLRVVLLRLASRVQTLRWYLQSGKPCPADMAGETLQVFAPLANRLGIGQFKWELEDLVFRFLQPADYEQTAAQVEGSRTEREQQVQAASGRLSHALAQAGLTAEVAGRPKHLYSIWKKAQTKTGGFERVLDARALRVLVLDEAQCYAALAQVHECWPAIAGELVDYIARPKGNGYQSLHTVVVGDDGQPLEVQIRTRAMHQHAEHGVAAHWLYKEAAASGQPGAGRSDDNEGRVAEARKAVLRELLAWQRDTSEAPANDQSRIGSVDRPGLNGGSPGAPAAAAGAESAAASRLRSPLGAGEGLASGDVGADERIYVFTPQATIIDLPLGGTPLDFAYSLHTDLGHRCRGAKVDGALVPLNTPLRSGQTVEVVATKEGGPSLDWLNAELHFLQSARSKAKVRAWFNTQAQAQTMARGRELVEKLLAREGRTALKLETLAEQLGFKTAAALFEVVGKDEFSLRNIENLLRPQAPAPEEEQVALRAPRSGEAGAGGAQKGSVLVVGVDSLLTTLGRCCRPVPPDAIAGYVTRGKGVSIHRSACSNLRHLAQAQPGRLIQVQWGEQHLALNPPGSKTGKHHSPAGRAAGAALFPMDLVVQATDRPGLLRDISEVFTKEQVNMTAAKTQPAHSAGTAWLHFTVELPHAGRLPQVLAQVGRVAGVQSARRK
jgi:GTP pyrophosphokinase